MIFFVDMLSVHYAISWQYFFVIDFYIFNHNRETTSHARSFICAFSDTFYPVYNISWYLNHSLKETKISFDQNNFFV